MNTVAWLDDISLRAVINPTSTPLACVDRGGDLSIE